MSLLVITGLLFVTMAAYVGLLLAYDAHSFEELAERIF